MSNDTQAVAVHPSLQRSILSFRERGPWGNVQVVLRNQRTATVLGGFYGLIIGDVRRNGRYFSFQAPVITRMPQSELRAVLISTLA